MPQKWQRFSVVFLHLQPSRIFFRADRPARFLFTMYVSIACLSSLERKTGVKEKEKVATNHAFCIDSRWCRAVHNVCQRGCSASETGVAGPTRAVSLQSTTLRVTLIEAKSQSFFFRRRDGAGRFLKLCSPNVSPTLLFGNFTWKGKHCTERGVLVFPIALLLSRSRLRLKKKWTDIYITT